MAKVKFYRNPVVVETLPGNTILRAAHQSGIKIKHPCGGKGVCGACAVKIKSGAGVPDPREIACLGEEKIAQGYRLACLTAIDTDMDVELP